MRIHHGYWYALLLAVALWTVVGTATATSVTMQNNVNPSNAQISAISRVAGDVANCKHPDGGCYSLSLADINDDGRPDLIVYYTSASEQGYCGRAGCGGVIIMATSSGYASKAIELPSFNGLSVLPDTHLGMHNLQFDGDSPIWKWSGQSYELAKADLPGAAATPWQTKQAAGHPLMAVATPIDSSIKNLLLFCEQGHPLLAMVTKVSLPAKPLTLTFGFRGWSVNVPMQPSPQASTLWTADLSGSELPQWLAHRGSNPTTKELASLATESFLRINGEMQGEISLEKSTQATQSAISRCYRY